jgi:hypothetical protein
MCDKCENVGNMFIYVTCIHISNSHASERGQKLPAVYVVFLISQMMFVFSVQLLIAAFGPENSVPAM